MGRARRYFEIILEEIRDQNKAVLEAVGQMSDQIKTLAKQADLEEVKADVKTIKLALTDTNRDVADLKRRVTRLEQKAC